MKIKYQMNDTKKVFTISANPAYKAYYKNSIV